MEVPFLCSDFTGQAIPEKARIVHQVALKQAARFAAQAVEPLQAVGANPQGRLADQTGMEIESSSHAEIHCRR